MNGFAKHCCPLSAKTGPLGNHCDGEDNDDMNMVVEMVLTDVIDGVDKNLGDAYHQV